MVDAVASRVMGVMGVSKKTASAFVLAATTATTSPAAFS